MEFFDEGVAFLDVQGLGAGVLERGRSVRADCCCYGKCGVVQRPSDGVDCTRGRWCEAASDACTGTLSELWDEDLGNYLPCWSLKEYSEGAMLKCCDTSAAESGSITIR